jgi:hypothetical protein
VKGSLALAALLLATATFAAEPPSPQRAKALYKEALAAREAKDLALYRAKLEDAAKTLPDPSSLWFRLAGARTLVGDRTAAFEALESMILAGIHRDDFETNEDLLPLHEHLRWSPLAAAHARLMEPIVRSEVAFTLPPSDRKMRLVEGIAYDPLTGSFFFSVVNERSILRHAPDGTLTVFAQLAGVLPGSPLGITVDAERRRLWTVTAGLPQGAGLPASEKDKSSLAAFDLATGALALRVDAPEHALLNDLTLAPDGTVYASDPGRGTVLRLRPGATALENLAPAATMVSPGGLALSADARHLFIADWGYGLAGLELATGAFHWLAPPPSGTMLGIDGLIRTGDTLIGIQNGVTPPRITRFTLSPDGFALTRADLLERAIPDWDEPTLGIFVGDSLHYVATSHWPKFDENGHFPANTPLPPTSLRRLSLN